MPERLSRDALKEHVKEEIKAGYSIEHTKDMLINHGHSKEDIGKAAAEERHISVLKMMKHFRIALARGFSDRQTRDYLMKKGCPEREANSVMWLAEKWNAEKLSEHIKKELSRGYTREQITEALLNYNYKKKDIDAAFLMMKKEEPEDKFEEENIHRYNFFVIIGVVFVLDLLWYSDYMAFANHPHKRGKAPPKIKKET